MTSEHADLIPWLNAVADEWEELGQKVYVSQATRDTQPWVKLREAAAALAAAEKNNADYRCPRCGERYYLPPSRRAE